MNAATPEPLDPLIEGYLTYLDKVGRKTPRTIVDDVLVILALPHVARDPVEWIRRRP